eukprot:CAMPEP_0202707226 /NCGR_PEP_ID=MMETSP1385-20130828/19559_1 /ASSEMBLY_ACC=CAM_ASM_000861 /TAXON_ID=933848 /ORGANISM="Elphidium margaritaceum" /LENGTH=260 /DNA_ID=CAMNT_0049365887 /DNA_START=63 /DNA_END=845 /DNA_ORIENTATION=+
MSILRALQLVIFLQWMLANIGAEGKKVSCANIKISGKSIQCDENVLEVKTGYQVRTNDEHAREATYYGVDKSVGTDKKYPWVTRMAGDIDAFPINKRGKKTKCSSYVLMGRMNDALKQGAEILVYQPNGLDDTVLWTITKKKGATAKAPAAKAKAGKVKGGKVKRSRSAANWLNAGDYYYDEAYAYAQDDEYDAYDDEEYDAYDENDGYDAYDDEEYDADEEEEEEEEEQFDEMLTKLYMKGYKAGVSAAKQQKLSRLLQ